MKMPELFSRVNPVRDLFSWCFSLSLVISNGVKEFFLNLLFPPYCVNCQREGSELCQDCLSLIDAPQNQYCPFCSPTKIVLDGRTCNFCRKTRNLDGLHNAASYQNFIIKKTISQFKYEPYVKALSKPLSLLIIKYFHLIEHPVRKSLLLNEAETALIPVPLAKKKLKKRGFNQAEEIARELSAFFKIPMLCNVLVKMKETSAQVELSGKEREENIKGVFVCKNPDAVKGKKILLIDDVFTTGSTMEIVGTNLPQVLSSF